MPIFWTVSAQKKKLTHHFQLIFLFAFFIKLWKGYLFLDWCNEQINLKSHCWASFFFVALRKPFFFDTMTLNIFHMGNLTLSTGLFLKYLFLYIHTFNNWFVFYRLSAFFICAGLNSFQAPLHGLAHYLAVWYCLKTTPVTSIQAQLLSRALNRSVVYAKNPKLSIVNIFRVFYLSKLLLSSFFCRYQ